MIVDDITEIRDNLSKLLSLEDEIEVVGTASNGVEAIERALNLRPDIILMDINMPVMDGIRATETLALELPQSGIIILSVQSEQEYLRKAMSAGAREYLTKPPSNDELVSTIKRVYEIESKFKQNYTPPPSVEVAQGKIITVFSTKGGVGKSTIAVNLTTAIAQLTQKKCVIIDLDLQFGDMAMMLDLIPRRTISDLVSENDFSDPKLIENYLLSHPNGVKIMPAPLRPEYAENIKAKHIEGVFKSLRQNFDYLIVDTSRSFDDVTLSALDLSDLILIITTLDVLTIKNVKIGLEAMAALHYESSRLKLLLNRASMEMGVSRSDLEQSLNFPVSYALPNDFKTTVLAANRGIPFVTSDPQLELSTAVFDLARNLTGLPPAKKEKTSFFGKLLVGGK